MGSGLPWSLRVVMYTCMNLCVCIYIYGFRVSREHGNML